MNEFKKKKLCVMGNLAGLYIRFFCTFHLLKKSKTHKNHKINVSQLVLPFVFRFKKKKCLRKDGCVSLNTSYGIQSNPGEERLGQDLIIYFTNFIFGKFPFRCGQLLHVR